MNRTSFRRLTWLLLCASAALAGCVASTQTLPPTLPTSDLRDRPAPNPDGSDALKRAQARLDLAGAYFGRGQVKTALDEVKLAIAADPTFGPAYSLRGLIYANLGDNALAEDSFKRALQIMPGDPDVMQNYGYFLCEQKRFPESTAFFKQALATPQYQGATRTLLALGVCQALAGQLAEADASLTRAYQLDPASPVTATNLAEVLYRRGQYERARFYIRRVNALANVSNAQTLWLAARIEHKMGDDAGTNEFGRQLSNRFPESREASAFARGAFDE
jgi:type IV pilus assembly protein PilF